MDGHLQVVCSTCARQVAYTAKRQANHGRVGRVTVGQGNFAVAGMFAYFSGLRDHLYMCQILVSCVFGY